MSWCVILTAVSVSGEGRPLQGLPQGGRIASDYRRHDASATAVNPTRATANNSRGHGLVWPSLVGCVPLYILEWSYVHDDLTNIFHITRSRGTVWYDCILTGHTYRYKLQMSQWNVFKCSFNYPRHSLLVGLVNRKEIPEKPIMAPWWSSKSIEEHTWRVPHSYHIREKWEHIEKIHQGLFYVKWATKSTFVHHTTQMPLVIFWPVAYMKNYDMSNV